VLQKNGVDSHTAYEQARHCMWLFNDFVLIARPTRDKKALELVYEQVRTVGAPLVRAQLSRCVRLCAAMATCVQTYRSVYVHVCVRCGDRG
jgi:hypothetical protein